MGIHRRRFLEGALFAGAGLVSLGARRRGGWQNNPFGLGIASGDPTDHAVILWTRLVDLPEDFAAQPLEVRWEIARDQAFRRVIQTGTEWARPEFAHSIHADVHGLEPASEYFYRFSVGGIDSPVGRTKTLPAPGTSCAHVRLAVASCQSFGCGYYTAYPHMINDNPDVVLFLGDYIYEVPHVYGLRAVSPEREVVGGTARTLDDYRNRYAYYKRDANLQAMHARAPWIVTWDDHEVENDYAGWRSEHDDRDFAARRIAAYQAYWEHQPIRSVPSQGNLALYRSFVLGDLLSLSVLDTRQYRAPNTMLGHAQEQWLKRTLDANAHTRWQAVGQQVAVTRHTPDDADHWQGTPRARKRLLDALSPHRGRAVVLTGDLHSAAVGELRDPQHQTIATEFITTSISSRGDSDRTDRILGSLLKELSPDLRYFETGYRGYMLCDVTPDEWLTRFRAVSTVAVATASIDSQSSWVVHRGDARAEERAVL